MCHGFQEITWHTSFSNVLLDKWKKVLNKENMSAIFKVLLKTFDTTNHGLLLAKLKAYAFSKQPLSFMCSVTTT